ncbi:reverse transcriptase domain-containing protein [Pseudomonas aeruginosa]|uniref:reverse transcriptase domain-containing protein n=1 Tax=Pseudomonas aeruginosa TaxID=287 RepID=UPI0009BA7D1F|nr:reverse transcriptase domain-containing protein [Pseudomonas aeruginosa]ARC79451.1 Reverse transcriptase [Pseudomonas aeruginosa]HBO5033485.1 reverse transcriptase [Pseudomonas aeruginosa]HCE6500173.1 reverse transcriptase [Pseudomonas aeruginosa]HCE9509943.1 reverse transcriptase [Pseudomonas aeruginosa]
MIISLESLGLAYRKAKADLYYSSHASLDAIADYEENLFANLSTLQAQINGDDTSWVTDTKFVGTWTLATKSVDMDAWKKYRKENGNGLFFSSPSEEWEHACTLLAAQPTPEKPNAEFRVMARCSMDFHVLSTLWMLEVGHLFDDKLTGCAYGNRLRRTQDGKHINPLSLGSFQPYLKPFRDWRDNGIGAMRTALDASKKIVALTADVSSFYHELSPAFMLDPAFISGVLGLELTEEQSKLNFLFIHALRAWAAGTPLKKGLPVGLPASAVVANVALIELDRVIEQQVAPIYYGRYVDDILLVMENGANFRSSVELWEWLFARAEGKLGWVEQQNHQQIRFQPSYLKHGDSESQIHFANSKNKVFLLADAPGQTLVDAIAHQIHQRASEWRAMPRLPRSANHVGTDLLAATQSDGEAADNLRKADALTMRRAGFAIKLRDFEAYERDLQPEAWNEHRRAFFQAYIQHVLVLPQFFDLAVYLPRVIRLATACEDFADLRKTINALEKLCRQVNDYCTTTIKASPPGNAIPHSEVITSWQNQLFASIRESITAAFPPQLSKAGKQAWDEHMADCLPMTDVDTALSWPLSAKGFQKEQGRLFSFDLAHLPFRFIGLPKEMVAQRGIPAKKSVVTCADATALLPSNVIEGNQVLAKWINLKGLPYGLLFATRPFNLPELFVLNKDAYATSGRTSMRAVVLAVRGFELGEKAPSFDNHGVLQIPDGASPRRYGIAVSSWKTRIESWTAAVTRRPDPDADRYARLCRLLDVAISQPQQSRYFVLPELALPAHWFIRIARKLQGRGISLITGIEYLHAGKARVRNQVWAALPHDGLGFPSLMIYRQDKQRPALHEEQELQRLAGLELKPDRPWKTPPIIQHGDLRFALLICSELTNISYRAALRGAVDVLFVPEWNQDTETFNSLVESAALDIHAYIIQCNDRQYGDSRIRAPFKDSWKRDVLRVKGGITDYCVIGEIDVQALRQFQSSYRSPGTLFKPVPDGFEINFDRKVLPIGGAEPSNT